MDMYFKTALVFAHFVMAAFCLVTIVSIDLKVLKNYARPASPALCDEIARVKVAITRGLIGLWSTGLLMVALGAASSPDYLSNEKLWFKVFVVVTLTLNGALVHRAGRVMQPGVVLAALDDWTALQLNLAGATSSISWMWACFLGTARAWNGTLPFTTILLYYLASLVVGLSIAVGMHLRRAASVRTHLADEGTSMNSSDQSSVL